MQYFAWQKQLGFTIVEVVVVIAVITILVGLGGASYITYQSRANNETRATRAQAIAASLEEYYSENGEYPSVHMLVNEGGNTADAVANLLGIDKENLVDPAASPGETLSVVDYADYSSSTESVYRYRGFKSGDTTPCLVTASGGFCEAFILSYRDTQNNTWEEIRSQHNTDLY